MVGRRLTGERPSPCLVLVPTDMLEQACSGIEPNCVTRTLAPVFAPRLWTVWPQAVAPPA